MPTTNGQKASRWQQILDLDPNQDLELTIIIKSLQKLGREKSQSHQQPLNKKALLRTKRKLRFVNRDSATAHEITRDIVDNVLSSALFDELISILKDDIETARNHTPDIGDRKDKDVHDALQAAAYHHGFDPHYLDKFPTAGYQDPSFSNDRPVLNNPEQIGVTPVIGAFATFQASYVLAANNSVLQNAPDIYKRQIYALKPDAIEAIFSKYPDQERRAVKIKELAMQNALNSMFNNTFISGVSISLTICVAIAMLLGPYAIFALIPFFAIGLPVSAYAALRNKYLLRNKIMAFMHNTEIDEAIKLKSDLHQTNKHSTNKLEDAALQKASAFASFMNISTKLSSIPFFVVLSVYPIVSSVTAVIQSVINWRLTNLELRYMKEHPAAALITSHELPIEQASIGTFRPKYSITKFLFAPFRRNHLRQYILDKGVNNVERELQQAGVKIPAKSRNVLYSGVYYVMKSLGLWESQRLNNILEALYDTSNDNSRRILTQLRRECSAKYLQAKLQKHYIQNARKLHIDHLSYAQIKSQHDAGEHTAYNTLLRSYLDNATANNASKKVKLTGYYSTFLFAVTIMAFALTFSPIGPAAIGIGIVAAIIGIGITRLAANIERRKMQKALATVQNSDIPQLFSESQTYVNEFQATPKPTKNHLPSFSNFTSKVNPKFYPTQDLRHNLDILCATFIANTRNKKFVSKTSTDGAVDIVMHNTDLMGLRSNQQQTILTFLPKQQHTQNANLRSGSKEAWQLYLQRIVQANKQEMIFSLGHNLTNDLKQQRAAAFVAAMLEEFSDTDDINCKLRIDFDDEETAAAIFSILSQPELKQGGTTYASEALNTLRSHFGLRLNNGQLQQINHGQHSGANNNSPNNKIFEAYLQAVAAKVDGQHSSKRQKKA